MITKELPDITHSTLDILADIAAMDEGSQREVAVHEFIKARMPMFTRQARGLCRINSVQPTKYLDDLTGMVAETAWEMIREALENPGSLAQIMTWEAMLYRRARVKVRSYIDRVEAPASGMTTARRRHREVQRTRSLLRGEKGAEPTDGEVIEATNARLAHLKDAAYQGMTITHCDLQMPGSAGDPETSMETHQVVDFAEDYILHPVEGAQIVTRTIEACYEADFTAGTIAGLWMGDVYSSGGPGEGTDTITHICKELGLTRLMVQDYVIAVRKVAIEVLADIGVATAS